MNAFLGTLVSSALLAGCSSLLPESAIVDRPASEWRLAATPADRARLREWRDSFVAALDSSRGAGFGAAIDQEGALLMPDAALAGPLPNGNYRCRVIKLGARSPGMPVYAAHPAFDCRIRQENDLQGFAKLGGSQRYMGIIFPGDAMRRIFLGTLVLGDEQRAMQYGGDQERDLAGFVERIGARRWRMLLPSPHFESRFDVVELVPTAATGAS